MDYTLAYEKITSRANPAIKHAAKLNKSSRYRRECNQFIIEGVRICRDAMLSGVKIDKVFFTARVASSYPDLISEFERVSHPAIYEIPEDIAQKLADTSTSQGLFCICSIPQNPPSLDHISDGGKYILLENISDPSNLGAIIRTAEALGITGAILSDGCCDLYNPKALRASMGSIFRFPTSVAVDFIGKIAQFRSSGIPVVASVPDRTAQSITDIDFSKGCAVIIGNEGNGISQQVQDACSVRAAIPMLGRAESLNASMAAAIIMWEMLR